MIISSIGVLNHYFAFSCLQFSHNILLKKVTLNIASGNTLNLLTRGEDSGVMFTYRL